MTIEECIDILDDNFTVLNTHGHYTEKEKAKAIEMAIASLEAWEKMRQEIDDYKYMPVRDLLITLNRHLQEVTG